MADRTLHWHVEDSVRPGTHPVVYELDDDYTAIRVWAFADILPEGADLTIDITDDGVSICDPAFVLRQKGTHDTINGASVRDSLNAGTLKKGSLIRLVTTFSGWGGAGSNLNVQLELNKG